MQPQSSILIPVSAIVATKNRPQALRRTLESLARQSSQPAETIVVDASSDTAPSATYARDVAGLQSRIQWAKAVDIGAARQRTQGVAAARENVVWFFDDDILFEPECVARLWRALEDNGELGGVNALIVNQQYQPPGKISRLMFQLMQGQSAGPLAGKVIGPAINLLPEDREAMPAVVAVEWLNTTCTMYRRAALPEPVFDSFFTDYSLMEDLALSLRVRQQGWQLANCRTARIFHDSQSANEQRDHRARAKMELVNRAYVMQHVLQRNSPADFARLALWELFSIASTVRAKDGLNALRLTVIGKIDALRTLTSGRDKR
jgi:GT2 family glycosyltransferase